jgi:hypothetical protein
LNTQQHGVCVWPALALAIASLAGCGGDVGRARESHIKKVTEVYTSYVAANQGRRPPNEAALKQYAKRLGPERLQVMGIDDVDSIFVSPRDSQPYVIAYASMKVPGAIIAHEKQGVDGKRLVATREGALQELEEAEFQSLLSGK